MTTENNASDLFVPRIVAPPQMFLNIPERNFQNHISNEVVEKIIGQEIMYYPLSKNTKYHPLYGEAINKIYDPPVQIYVLVEHSDDDTKTTGYGVDRRTKIKVHVSKKRLIDKNLRVYEGDIIFWNNEYHEIYQISESRLLFGNVSEDERVETALSCVKVRKGTFNE